MKTTLTALTLALSLIFTLDLSARTTPFTAIATLDGTTRTESLEFTSFVGTVNNNKVVLNWTINQNVTAYQFEVERSTDGKNFVMAALVFGTDKAETDNYMFYEKIKEEGSSYRIKVVQKDGTVYYSSIIVAKGK
ncbi:MAG: hypothetical protein H7Y42_10195 [Chitinophagaceae bacterium]|nr:hypothetical protein [Chitinophagaceae bacterium]